MSALTHAAALSDPPPLAPAPGRLRLVEAVESHPLPSSGVVLIGTGPGVASLLAQVQTLDPRPALSGWIDLSQHAAEVFADGLERLGRVDDLRSLHRRARFKAALVSVPRSMKVEAAKLRRLLEQLHIPATFVPTLEELLAPENSSDAAALAPARPQAPYRPAPTPDLADLIGRRPHPIDHEAVARVLSGKRVLITGAGGSIGGELARIAALYQPEELVLMERSENALFEIDRQIASRFPSVRRRAVLHDVVDADATLRHLVQARPHVVFHAAAHKHVPLMEDHPAHAVNNNLFGTKAIADAAAAVGAERFVLISTDKAVNPISVMGATKRTAEVYIRWLGSRQGMGTRFSLVRFGNVLGSACSVLTIWSQQIAEGGPLTVTDERMTRYFMTIPEAAALVIQSAAVEQARPGAGAPVFVLDMGEPVRILDLAERFVRGHGLEPRPIVPADGAEAIAAAGRGAALGRMDIILTGIRPGEKLHEQLAYDAELLRPTAYPGIHTWGGPAPEGHDALWVTEMMSEMATVRHSHDRAAVIMALRRFVPGFGPGGGVPC